MQPVTDFGSLSMDKENILPIPQGRSASKLSELINTDSNVLQSQLAEQRLKFEKNLDPQFLQDLDDPLDSYLQYIKWIRENYRSGNTHESLLIQVLERTTHDFKDDDYYKNEIRYFKVWLEYITYSDHPGDVFNYLFKKKIGSDLSLFYENYSLFFELNDQWEKAEEILKLGLSIKARPLPRLSKSYDEFLTRRSSKTAKEKPRLAGLSNPGGTGLTSQVHSKKEESKIKIFRDAPSNSDSKFLRNNDTDGGSDNFFSHINEIRHSKKENIINPTSWKGETLKNSGKTLKEASKIEVFDDKSNQYPITNTLKHQDGKHFETFDFNFDLFMPDSSANNPRSMIEVLLMFHQKNVDPVENNPVENTENDKKRGQSEDISYNTPRNKKSRTESESASASTERTSGIADTPLLEYFKNSKSGLFPPENNSNEISVNGRDSQGENKFKLSQSNSLAVTGNHLLSEKNEAVEQNETQSNLLDAIIGGAFSDIFTDTVTKQMEPKTPSKERKPKIEELRLSVDNIDDVDNDLLSSPFVENPNNADEKARSASVDPPVVNPFDTLFKRSHLKHIEMSIYQNNHLHNFDSKLFDKLRVLHKVLKPNAPALTGNKQTLLEFEKNEEYSVIMELGRGGFATVYLGEQLNGQLSAIKAERPSDIWEAYILSKLNTLSNDFIKLKSFFKFGDESYLILPYLQQGTVLELVSSLSNYQFLTGKNLIEESLVIYFTIQLISRVLKLHSLGIVHCDIKPDNCMLNIQSAESKIKFNDIVLIDFGRSIDLSLFPKSTKFKCKLEKTDNQDCPEFVNQTSWTYEPDYYGIANIVHTLLFQKVIKVQSTSKGVQLLEHFKRYWQRDLWNELFDLLLNPRKYNESGDVYMELEKVMCKLESWFSLTVDKRTFLDKLTQISEILNTRFKRTK